MLKRRHAPDQETPTSAMPAKGKVPNLNLLEDVLGELGRQMKTRQDLFVPAKREKPKRTSRDLEV